MGIRQDADYRGYAGRGGKARAGGTTGRRFPCLFCIADATACAAGAVGATDTSDQDESDTSGATTDAIDAAAIHAATFTTPNGTLISPGRRGPHGR